jgi:tetratricopeptide (TPR) repeat protein
VKAQLLLIFTLLVVNSGVAHSQTPVPNPQTTATPTVTPTTTVAPKSSQSNKVKTSERKLSDTLEAVDKELTSVVFFLAKIVVFLLSLLVIQRILLLIIYRSSQLIIDNFSNATGADEIDSVLPGLSQLTREKLIREMKVVHQRVKQHIEKLGPQTYRPPDNLPLPRSTPDQRLANLVASLNEFTPDQIDPVVQLLKVIFPPFGTKVTCILQSQGEEHKRLGMTFEITDIEGRVASVLYTIWESPDRKIVNSSDEQSKIALKDRFRQLQRTATRWLAVELCRQEMVKAVPFYYFGKSRKHYQARIHNFFGVLNQTSAQTHGHFFYQLAIEDLQTSINLNPDWYQPYDNLAETYYLLGRTEQGDRRVGHLQNAIAHYEEALKRVLEPTVQLRIKVAKAIAQLLTGKEDLILAAKQEIQNLETAKYWDATTVLNYRLLYYLACWYALAYHLDVADETQKQAYRYLTYSLARDKNREYWEWAGKDPDLESIRAGFPELKSALLKTLNEKPELPTLTGKDFVKSIEEVLGAVNWGSGNSGPRSGIRGNGDWGSGTRGQGDKGDGSQPTTNY